MQPESFSKIQCIQWNWAYKALYEESTSEWASSNARASIKPFYIFIVPDSVVTTLGRGERQNLIAGSLYPGCSNSSICSAAAMSWNRTPTPSYRAGFPSEREAASTSRVR